MSAPERPPVLIRWIARPDACADCKRIAAGSPYERLPTWPGLGDTRCTVCRCSVEGTRAGNVMAPASAYSETPSAPQAVAPEPIVAAQPAVAAQTVVAAAPAFAAGPEVEMPASFAAAPTVTDAPRKTHVTTALRIAPLERRWTIALGALIFIAIVAALIGR